MVTIDFQNAGSYGSKQWEAMKRKQEDNKKKITRWRSATGGWVESKRGRLYVDGEPVYKWKGWGLGKGVTYYEKGKDKYKRSIGTNKSFFEDYLKKIMKPYKIPVLKRRKR